MAKKAPSNNLTMKKQQTQNIVLHGISISPGMASGKAFVYQDILEWEHESYDIEADQVTEEHTRIKRAIDEVHQDLQHAAQRVEEDLDTELAEVFRAQAAILSDVSLAEEILQGLEEELINAEAVTKQVLRRWEKKFRAMEDAVLSQRADDIVDLSRRLLRELQGIHAHSLENMPENSVLMAKRLLPSDTVFLSRHSTVAVVVECGGPGSHAALLTRALGIPAVGQIEKLLQKVESEDLVLVNGTEGRVTIQPDAHTRETFERRSTAYQDTLKHARSRCHEPAITGDGKQIEVMANITCREDVEHAVENGADGIGLYRIESFYLTRKIFPTQQELFEELQHALEPIKEKPMTIRLLDIGGDKIVPYLNLPHEDDPFLGRRGVRLLLDYPDLLETQLQAILRLSLSYAVRILVPMITVVEDLKRVREKLSDVANDLAIATIPPLGAMLETPAAALCTKEFLAYTDFFSIGTNDLTQYTMAAGRENPLVNRYFQDDHPAIFKLLRMIVSQAGNTPVSLCGELAGKTDALARLLQVGIRSLSVPAPLVPIVKETIRHISLEA